MPKLFWEIEVSISTCMGPGRTAVALNWDSLVQYQAWMVGVAAVISEPVENQPTTWSLGDTF